MLLVVALGFMILSSAPASAQIDTGAVAGLIRDSQGAVMLRCDGDGTQLCYRSRYYDKDKQRW